MDRGNDVLFLEIPSKKIVVRTSEGDREFTLREFMADKLMKYLELRFFNFDRIKELAQAGKQDEAVAMASSGSIDMLKLALGDDVDDEWINNNLTSSMKEVILGETDKLCKVAELLGNVQTLVQEQPPIA